MTTAKANKQLLTLFGPAFNYFLELTILFEQVGFEETAFFFFCNVYIKYLRF